MFNFPFFNTIPPYSIPYFLLLDLGDIQPIGKVHEPTFLPDISTCLTVRCPSRALATIGGAVQLQFPKLSSKIYNNLASKSTANCRVADSFKTGKSTRIGPSLSVYEIAPAVLFPQGTGRNHGSSGVPEVSNRGLEHGHHTRHPPPTLSILS